MPRDFRKAAEAQNRAAWGNLVSSAAGYVREFEAQCEEAADRSQEVWLRRRDARLRERIRDTIEWSGGFCRSVYFRNLLVAVFSADDAVRELTKLLRKEQRRIRRKHWSCANHAGEIEAIKEALAYSRWFRRHEQRVWAKQERAA